MKASANSTVHASEKMHGHGSSVIGFAASEKRQLRGTATEVLGGLAASACYLCAIQLPITEFKRRKHAASHLVYYRWFYRRLRHKKR
jgi:hypothetical protein